MTGGIKRAENPFIFFVVIEAQGDLSLVDFDSK